MRITPGTTKALKVIYDIIQGEPDQSVEVDFYVLALGQNIMDSRAAGGVIDIKILNILEPIYDINQIYTNNIYGTVLGLKTQGANQARGLEIIGAAAYELAKARKMKHPDNPDNRRSRQSIIPEMENQVKSEVANVIVPPQLASVKTSVGAIHSVTPKYITEGVNFSSDNRTVIQTHIASRYPDVSPGDANDYIVPEIIKHRRTGYHPLGYNPQWVLHWQRILDFWNHFSRASAENKQRQRLKEVGMRAAQEALEIAYREKWRSMNQGVQAFFDVYRISSDNFKALKIYLSGFTPDERKILFDAYRNGVKIWTPQETMNVLPELKVNLEGDIEIVLEGFLSPEQGEFVARIIALP